MNTRRSKDNIINLVVENAADIMEAKAEYNELVAEQLAANGKSETADRLRSQNKRIAEAVKLIRENAGCWA